MKIKICGVRNQEMLTACENFQVDFIGLNFVSTSKRKIPNGFVPHTPLTKVGIFQNNTIQEISESSLRWSLDIIQLHGTESPEFIERLKPLVNTPIWKAFPVDKNFETRKLQEYSKNCELFLFDGKTPGSGTKIVDNKVLLDAISESKKLDILVGIAGGINDENIKEFKEQFPEVFLLDTASGTEENSNFSYKKLEKVIKQFRNE